MCLIHLELEFQIKQFPFIPVQHLLPVLYYSSEYEALFLNQVFTALHKCQLKSNLLPDCVPTYHHISPSMSLSSLETLIYFLYGKDGLKRLFGCKSTNT